MVWMELSEEELNLFEPATILAAKLGAGAAQVVGAEPFDTNLRLLERIEARIGSFRWAGGNSPIK